MKDMTTKELVGRLTEMKAKADQLENEMVELLAACETPEETQRLYDINYTLSGLNDALETVLDELPKPEVPLRNTAIYPGYRPASGAQWCIDVQERQQGKFTDQTVEQINSSFREICDYADRGFPPYGHHHTQTDPACMVRALRDALGTSATGLELVARIVDQP